MDPLLDARTIGLDPRAASKEAISMGVAVGRRKHAVVLAALRSRLINVPVTDEQTAVATLGAGHGCSPVC